MGVVLPPLALQKLSNALAEQRDDIIAELHNIWPWWFTWGITHVHGTHLVTVAEQIISFNDVLLHYDCNICIKRLHDSTLNNGSIGQLYWTKSEITMKAEWVGFNLKEHAVEYN